MTSYESVAPDNRMHLQLSSKSPSSIHADWIASRIFSPLRLGSSSKPGNASTHSVKNLPVLLAGGGFQHGQHLAFDEDKHPPLCNLFVSMLQRMDIEADRFGSSTGTLTGLENAS